MTAGSPLSEVELQKGAHVGTAAHTRTQGSGTVGSWLSAPPPLANCLTILHPLDDQVRQPEGESLGKVMSRGYEPQ